MPIKGTTRVDWLTGSVEIADPFVCSAKIFVFLQKADRYCKWLENQINTVELG